MVKNLLTACVKAVAVILLTSPLLTSCVNDDTPIVTPEYATLKEALQGIDRISMIVENPDTAAIRERAIRLHLAVALRLIRWRSSSSFAFSGTTT